MKKLLLVDDEQCVLNALRRRLRQLDVEVTAVADVQQALSLCQQQQFELIISDQRMPQMEGTDFLREVRPLQPSARCILLSGHSDFDAVTRAFNDGIIEQFIAKPWQDAELLQTLRQLLGLDVQPLASGCQLFHRMLSADAGMHRCFEQIRRLAAANAPVFIYGETGTGKELAARAIHQESSRSRAPFVAVNCANFSEQLMESELFGHRKGAFTHAVADRAGLLAEADGGTLFLDEVTTLPLELQARLLRVLQEREYRPVGSNQLHRFDVQLISASSTRLSEAVEQGLFRADLQYRLEVLPLDLPPLRARGDDAVLLFEYYLNQLSPGKRWSLAAAAAQQLRQYSFPGNVRQLYNFVQYTVAMAASSEVQPCDLPQHLMQRVDETTSCHLKATADVLSLDMLDVEGLRALLDQHNNNRTATAARLGVSRMTLWRRMSALGLI
ncbi:MAG: sigma-54 dependent transcriptional regulator [Marinobacterium sp.]|nr:sigma-54 dependent transcriptional regulator [Marinobacterium sp.]